MREHPNSATENANNAKDQANIINSSYDRDQKSSGSSEMPPVFKSITIGELTNSIITRDFEANSGNVRQLIGSYPPNDWKPQPQQQPPQQRRPPMKMYEGPNDKTSDNMQQHISNQNIKYNCDISTVNFYNQPQQSSMNGLNIRSGPKPSDERQIHVSKNVTQQFQNMERYVKNKIVEAMTRSEDARHEESQYERNDKSQEVPEKRKDSLIKRHDDFQQYNKQPITPTFAGQYYPYNALNVQSQNTSDIIPTSTSAIPSSSIEPKPLLQAKYDALSDED